MHAKRAMRSAVNLQPYPYCLRSQWYAPSLSPTSLQFQSALDFRFDGKRAVVTGAGKGIGYDLCAKLIRSGAEVIAVTRTQADLDKLQAELGDKIIPALIDVSNVAETTRILTGMGDIDLVVNNAGIASLEPFLQTKPESFDEVIAINLRAVLVISQIAAKNMIARGVGGAIVNISSQGSKVGLVDHASYCASKGGLDQLTRVMAVELGQYGIRSNCVNPTVVLTAMGKLAWSDPIKSAPMLGRIPTGRFAETSDVVDACMFLLSDKSSMCNGAMLPIDGGFLVT